MRSKQYFTSIKNNPHEISTDPVHSFHDPAAGEDAPDADVLVYDENVRILALLESALGRVDADKL